MDYPLSANSNFPSYPLKLLEDLPSTEGKGQQIKLPDINIVRNTGIKTWQQSQANPYPLHIRSTSNVYLLPTLYLKENVTQNVLWKACIFLQALNMTNIMLGQGPINAESLLKISQNKLGCVSHRWDKKISSCALKSVWIAIAKSQDALVFRFQIEISGKWQIRTNSHFLWLLYFMVTWLNFSPQKLSIRPQIDLLEESMLHELIFENMLKS